MKYQFHHEQLHHDLDDFWGFFTGFGKSFVPGEVKLQGKPLGFWEKKYIGFRLTLVEMGISKVIRVALILIVGLILFFTIFIHADALIKFVCLVGFLLYVAWQYAPHLVDDLKVKDNGIFEGKPTSTVSGLLINMHNTRITTQESAKSTWASFIENIKKSWDDIMPF